MSNHELKLARPPIVEALLDIDCDMPIGQSVASLEAVARDRFRDRYPKVRSRTALHAQFEVSQGGSKQALEHLGVQAFQFLNEDETQIVQVRAQGFTFNRLAPYLSLDEYLPEIERTWRLFVEFASPVQPRLIRLRYINRIVVPVVNDRLILGDFFVNGPRAPVEEKFTYAGFLNQQALVEKETGYHVNIVLTAQQMEGDRLPVVLDIEASTSKALEPGQWGSILSVIQSLRSLKNRIFFSSVTPRCLELFQ